MLRVLVYGSLRKGLHNDIHRYRASTGAEMELKGECEINAEMHSLGSYPYIHFNKDGVTLGEVYEITSEEEAMLRGLDTLEGYRGEGKDNFYNRKEVETPWGPAWVYFFDKPYSGSSEKTLVKDGDWKAYVNNLR